MTKREVAVMAKHSVPGWVTVLSQPTRKIIPNLLNMIFAATRNMVQGQEFPISFPTTSTRGGRRQAIMLKDIKPIRQADPAPENTSTFSALFIVTILHCRITPELSK
jgi:hypothetical protein